MLMIKFYMEWFLAFEHLMCKPANGFQEQEDLPRSSTGNSKHSLHLGCCSSLQEDSSQAKFSSSNFEDNQLLKPKKVAGGTPPELINITAWNREEESRRKEGKEDINLVQLV